MTKSKKTSIPAGLRPHPEIQRKMLHMNARVHELEEALHFAETAQDAALCELDDLARYLSHDLRAPLRGIGGYSKALLEDYSDRLDPLALAYLQYISDAGRLAADVLDKLIQYIRTPRAELNLQHLDLSGMAEEIITRIQLSRSGSAPLDDPHRHFSQKIEPGLSAYADERLTRLLLETIFENAVKFSSRRSEAMVSFSTRDVDEIKYLCIQDNGVGFDPAYTGLLFQPFQRLHSAHEFEGVGMGLALARRIIERHGGRIWADGEIDHGVSVYFTLGQN